MDIETRTCLPDKTRELVLEAARIIKGLQDIGNSIEEGTRPQRNGLRELHNNSTALEGIIRLRKKVETEKGFLDKMLSGSVEMTAGRVWSSNLGVYGGILKILQCEDMTQVTAVGQTFTTNTKHMTSDISIVTEGGGKWIKIKSMSSRNIEDSSKGRGRHSDKSVGELAQEMVSIANDHPHQYGTPSCYLVFTNPIPADVSMEISEQGVTPQSIDECCSEITQRQLAEELGDGMSFSDSEEDYQPAANLDITALFALVSDLTNSEGIYEFPSHPVLNAQAVEDRQKPLKPILDDFLAGKRVISCQTAVDNFLKICATVAGKGECSRASKLLEQIEVVPDSPSQRFLSLPPSNRIKPRQVIIFGTGDTHKAVTITANIQFVQAASDRGVSFPVFIHGARALAEQKRVAGGVLIAEDDSN